MPDNMIMIWKWTDTPEIFKKLSQHGGDEDWVARIPPHFEIPKWIWSIGVCRTDLHVLDNGARILIGAHA